MTQPLMLNVHGAQQEAIAIEDWPGRWLGGVVGALGSAAAAAVLVAAETSRQDLASSIVGGHDAVIAALGIPIAFALGRAAFPSIRRGGWRWALVAGVLIGLAAPPLGALEILFGPLLLPIDPEGASRLGLIAFLPIALVFSYAVVWITIPVGLLTALAIRAVPRGLPERLRAPDPLARIGVAHALLALTVWAAAVQIVTSVARS